MTEEKEYNDLDIDFLNKAIELSGFSASKNGKLVGGPFGAIIVRDNKILGQAINNVLVLNDPTAHAEVQTIRMACANEKSFDLKGATLYTSCEPCPMCLMAAKWANIGKIYYAATRKDAAKIGFQDDALYKMLKRGKYATPIKECHRHAILEMRRWKKKFGEDAQY